MHRTFHRQLWLLLLPYLLGTVLLVLLPVLTVVGIAFTEYHAVEAPRWVGVDNFARLAEARLVRFSLWNTLILAGLAVPLRVGGAFALALLLGKQGRLLGWSRAAVFLPTVIPEVAYALLWVWLLNPEQGPLNGVLGAVGLPTPVWLAEPGSARLAIVLLLALQLGEGFVALLAGLRSIPRMVYEAAAVEGASAWQSFRFLTLPLIAPWLLLLTLRDLLVSVQTSFTPSFILTYGGPSYATTFLPLLVYELGFDYLDLGLAAALLVLGFAVLLLIVLAARRLARRAEVLDV